MSEPITQIENGKLDAFFGFKVNMSLKNFTDAEQQIVVKEFSTVYDRLMQYLAKWYNFSDNNIFNFALEYAIRKVQETNLGLDMNGTQQVLTFADCKFNR